MQIIVLLSLIFIAGSAFSQDVFEGKATMNEISFSDFKDFEKNWKLVTVRFRKDTEEMRWTFANDLAWKTLESGSTHFPEGSVFAKIGIRTVADSQFTSSSVPMGARRYQFMVKNSTKYSTTDGWGYALFDINGKTFPEDHKTVAQSCHACHKIVENRGYVFSQPFEIAPFAKLNHFVPSKGAQVIEFEDLKTSELPKNIISILPKGISKIRSVKNKMLKEVVFQGTLDEIKPTLEREAYESQLSAAILISSDKKRYSLVFKSQSENCKKNRFFVAISTKLDGTTQTNEYCNP